MRNALALAAALTIAAGISVADDKTDFAGEFKKISAENQKALMRLTDRAKAAEATKKNQGDLQQLVKKAETQGPANMSAADLSAVAQANERLRKLPDALKWADLAIKADAKNAPAHQTKIRALVQTQKIDEAEKALAEASSLSAPIQASLHLSLYQAQNTKKNLDAAIKHLKHYVDYQFGAMQNNPAMATTFGYYVRDLGELYSDAKKPDDGLIQLLALATKLKQAAASKPALSAAAADMQLAVAEFHRDLGREAEAARIVKDEVAAAETAFAAAKGEIRGFQLARRAKVLEAHAQTLDDAEAAKIRAGIVASAVEEAVNHRKEPAVVRTITAALSSLVGEWCYTDSKAAGAALARLKDLPTTLGEDLAGRDRTSLESQLENLATRVEAAVKRDAIVGKPATEPNPDAWINGAPLSPSELKGKVILLDFWAVWCGPCIATFPHLREWHEHFAKDGLVIIGATKYYGYAWDPAAKRPVNKGKEYPKDEERKETEKFLAHHQLKHPIAFFKPAEAPEGERPVEPFSAAYNVSGIPQAVVIDRKGNVRLIRVGSGKANAKAIEKMIRKCLAEPAA